MHDRKHPLPTALRSIAALRLVSYEDEGAAFADAPVRLEPLLANGDASASHFALPHQESP